MFCHLKSLFKSFSSLPTLQGLRSSDWTVQGLFVDRMDTYVGYVLEELQGELYSVDGAHYGFAGVTL